MVNTVLPAHSPFLVVFNELTGVDLLSIWGLAGGKNRRVCLSCKEKVEKACELKKTLQNAFTDAAQVKEAMQESVFRETPVKAVADGRVKRGASARTPTPQKRCLKKFACTSMKGMAKCTLFPCQGSQEMSDTNDHSYHRTEMREADGAGNSVVELLWS